MHPIERLRFIARADDESAAALAAEAAWTLGELGCDDPAAVVTASKRLLERQPACGPLWWVCAGLVGAPDPFETAGSLAEQLLSDRVADELAVAIRASFPDTDVICALPPLEVVRTALERRGTHALGVIAPYRRLRGEFRLLREMAGEVTGHEPGEAATVLAEASVLLVEPVLASTSGVVLEPWCVDVLEAAGLEGVPVWAVLPTGRVVDPSVAEAALALSSGEMSTVSPDVVTSAISSTGEGTYEEAVSAHAAPLPPELARWLRQLAR